MKDRIKKIISKKWFVPFLLILITISISTYFRMMPSNLPITDNWAKDTVYNYYKNQARLNIDEKYPQLPEKNKIELINKAMMDLSNEQIELQIKETSKSFKKHLQDKNGDTYLIAIDPFMWWFYAKNIIKYGKSGELSIGGRPYDSLRDGRLPHDSGVRTHSWVLVFLYKFINIFTNISLMRAIFLFPVIFIGLSIIPIFLTTKKIIGDYGAFFTGIVVAINIPLLSRTIGGFSDTDTYNVLWPAFAIYFLFNAFYVKKIWQRYLFIGLSALSTFGFFMVWSGWYYLFDFFLAMLGIYLIYLFIKNRFKFTKKVKKYTSILVWYFITTAMLITFSPHSGFNKFIKFITGPIWILTMKGVGVITIWPNVLTTVAEFNTNKISTLVGLMGGKIFLAISLIGLIYCFRKNKKMFILSLLWTIGSIYSFTKGTRFSILLVPIFAIAFGIGIGYLFKLSSILLKSMNADAWWTKAIIGIVLLLILISPIKAANNQAMRELPSFEDVWYDALQDIKNDASDGIITSWWDFGHWFYTISDRRVTFDGGDQGKRIYWVGRVLLTDNETEAIRILRMLNCGQNTYYEKLIDGGYSEKDAIDLINKEINKGEKWCSDEEIIPQYFIASSDMVSKAGVWSHFGSWDFDRAQLWQDVRNGKTEGVDENIIYEIQNTPADQWIAPWLTYSGVECKMKDNESLYCANGMTIYKNMTTDTNIKYIVYMDNETFVKKELDPEGAASLLITPSKGIYIVNNEMAGSTFTKAFFFEGKGLNNFNLLSYKKSQITGMEIYVYKVRLE